MAPGRSTAMTIAPFVRIVRAGWPEVLQAEVFAHGKREVIQSHPFDVDKDTIEAFAESIRKQLIKKGVYMKPWEDIGPCCKQAEVVV